jgi:isopenicillin N synthase-like dioxygenase
VAARLATVWPVTALVPTVDLGPWRDGTDRTATATALDDAARRIGFFQVVGHGIAPGTIEAMRSACDAFFALPLAEKLACRPDRPGINRGYAAKGTEALSYSLGIDAPAPDLFEAFNIGPDDVPDDDWHGADPFDFFAPNIWPARVASMRPALVAYLAAAQAVALTLTDVFAAALDLPARWFAPYVDRSTITMRVNHYERRADDAEPVPGQMRMGAHTDYGIVTVLLADPVPGLQIVGPDGGWHDVVADEGALLVNLGDLTARWTNDRWRSTVHRVVPPPADATGTARRRSVALFFDGNYDATITCLPTCAGATEPARYPPVRAGEHLIDKILGPRTLSPSAGGTTVGERLAAVTGDQPPHGPQPASL